MDGTDLLIAAVGVMCVAALLGLSPGRWLVRRLALGRCAHCGRRSRAVYPVCPHCGREKA